MSEKRKHVVFISLPMNGLNEDVIIDNINDAKRCYLRNTGRDIQDVAFVNTMDNPDPPLLMDSSKYGVWYLGHSLIKLSQCDEVFFYRDWSIARGCIVEHTVCEHYGIPHRHLQDLD